MKNLQKVSLAVILLAAFGAGLWLSLPDASPQASDMQAITLIPTPRALPDVQLVDKTGAGVGREFFTGRWSMLFMGFTSCGHFCPTKMAEMRMIHDALDKPLQVVFLSVDPGRDKPEIIRRYVEGFDASFQGATGSPEVIEQIAGALGAPYFVDTNPDNYIVDHSSSLFIIGPEGRLRGYATPPLKVSDVVADLSLLL